MSNIKVVIVKKELRIFRRHRGASLVKTGMFFVPNLEIIVGEPEEFFYKKQSFNALPVLDLEGFYILEEDIGPETWVRYGSEFKPAVVN
jgi:hypothetical protein